MADQVINYNNIAAQPRDRLLIMKQISWAAVFSGVLVALAVEVVFLSFGLFIGFRLSPSGASIWSTIWYWVGCFFSLLAGGWIAARLGGNPEHGKVHGIVTWGVATVTTFVFLTALSWGVLNQSVGMVRTAALATATAVPATTQTPAEANRVQNEANRTINQAQQQAPYVAQTVAHDISMISLVMWIGFLVAGCGSIVGGALGAPKQVVPAA